MTGNDCLVNDCKKKVEEFNTNNQSKNIKDHLDSNELRNVNYESPSADSINNLVHFKVNTNGIGTSGSKTGKRSSSCKYGEQRRNRLGRARDS